MIKLGNSCALAVALLLAGCATDQGPEPVVKTVVVDRAVPVPCRPEMPLRPDLLPRTVLRDKLAGLENFDDKMKLVADQLLLYMAWTVVQDEALSACAQPIAPGDATTRPK